MYILKERWPKLKQELIPTIAISTFHAWWCFNFPPIIRAGYTEGTMIGMSIAGIIGYFLIFSYADILAARLNSDYLDESMHGPILKNIRRIGFLGGIHIGAFIMWYKDWYHMPSIYYVLFYLYYIMFFFLVSRAIKNASICN